VRAQDLEEPGPLAGIGVVLGHAPADALAPGGVAEDAGEGVVAVEDGAVGRQGAENPGLVALEQRPVALLRLAQRFLGALAGADVTREEDGADGLPVAVDERGERHADLDRLPLPGAEDHLGVAHHLSPRQVETHGGAHPGLGQPLDGSAGQLSRGVAEDRRGRLVGEPDRPRQIADDHRIGHRGEDLLGGEGRREVDQAVAPDGVGGDGDEDEHRRVTEGVERHAVGPDVVERAEIGGREPGHQQAGAPAVGPRARRPVVLPVLVEAQRQHGEEEDEERHAEPAEARVVPPPVVIEIAHQRAGGEHHQGEAGGDQPPGPYPPAVPAARHRSREAVERGGDEADAEVRRPRPDQGHLRAGGEVHEGKAGEPDRDRSRQQGELHGHPRAALAHQHEDAEQEHRARRGKRGNGVCVERVARGIENRGRHLVTLRTPIIPSF
jgi:hypothetical protein